MKKVFLRAGPAACALALALSLSPTASANISADFADCDGLEKPKRSDDGMRGEATKPTSYFGGNESPQLIVAACTRALEGGALQSEQTLRRANILRARAVAKLGMNDKAGALADLDAATEAGSDRADDFFYDRSMGVSLDMIRAIILNEMGQTEQAINLANTAAAKRPYALEIQRVAALFETLDQHNAAPPSVGQKLARIDPATRAFFAQILAPRDELAELAATAGPPSISLSELVLTERKSQNGASSFLSRYDWDQKIRAATTTAYALAAQGDAVAARAWLSETKSAIQAAGARDKPQDDIPLENYKKFQAYLMHLSLTVIFEPVAELVEARVALAEGRLIEAAQLFQARPRNPDAITREFHTTYTVARDKAPSSAPELPAMVPPPKPAQKPLAQFAKNLLIHPESQSKLIEFKESKPAVGRALLGAAFSMGTTLLSGVGRTSGFRSTPQDDGSIMVEYTGNTSSAPVVQEMTMLRAAEIAREAGKSHFHIVKRSDYQRSMQTSRHGVPISQRLLGYKTELTIRLLDSDENQEQALNSASIIEALGPIYYEDKS